jgi:hypothetical protein
MQLWFFHFFFSLSLTLARTTSRKLFLPGKLTFAEIKTWSTAVTLFKGGGFKSRYWGKSNFLKYHPTYTHDLYVWSQAETVPLCRPTILFAVVTWALKLVCSNLDTADTCFVCWKWRSTFFNCYPIHTTHMLLSGDNTSRPLERSLITKAVVTWALKLVGSNLDTAYAIELKAIACLF